MAAVNTSLSINALHALGGRLLSHVDTLAGEPRLPPEIAKDMELATSILDALCEFLGVIASQLPDWPESSRSSHHSSRGGR
jgi:hypothetical protein